jgi:3D (Asp-Asp-Asp) domain-containing protein
VHPKFLTHPALSASKSKVSFMKPAVLLFLTLVSIGLVISKTTKTAEGSSTPTLSVLNCSDGWRITGYYTPVETDFTSKKTHEIDIRGFGKESFNAEFLDTVFSDKEGFGEGWGKTRFGWYVGEYNGKWHIADAPLDADDHPLESDSVAVDNSVIPPGSTVTIPDLPRGLGDLQFKSTDVGVTVHGKHVDVYTGEGREARRKMGRFTYEDDEDGKGLTRVCFQPPAGQ